MSKHRQSKVVAELRKRASATTESKQLRIEDYCFDKQIKFINDPARFKTAVCSRRAGKSVACAVDLVFTAATQRGDVAYITTNRRNAKKIIWREVLKLNKEYNLGGKPDNTELTLSMPNGNVIHLSGAKDETEAEKLRGLSFRKVYIDEVQSFRPYIEDTINDIIAPALTDYNGSLILIGTPGIVKTGFFFKASHSAQWSNHYWTMEDNPHIEEKSGIKTLDFIKGEAARRELSMDSPAIQREWFGRWVNDEDSRVYNFNPDKNIFVGEVPADIVYVFGVDIGFDDADAIAVLGYSASEQRVYVVEEYIKTGSDITTLVNKVKELQHKYSPVKIVMDAGALGKKIQEEILQRHQVFMFAAEKQRKTEFIALMNDDLRTGRIQFRPKSRFEEDSYLLQWDTENPARRVISDKHHSDVCFVAGTLVQTSNGPKSIELISTSDQVLTRAGYMSVKWAAKTSDSADLLRLTFSNNSQLTCTPSHPIFTKNRGFVAAKDLTASDECYTIQEWEKINKKASYEKLLCLITRSFTATLKASVSTLKTIIAGIGAKRNSCSTEQLGFFIMGPFQNLLSFITKTITLSTTTSQTWSVCLQKTILGSINIGSLQKREDCIWSESGLLRPLPRKLQNIRRNFAPGRLDKALGNLKQYCATVWCVKKPILLQLFRLSQKASALRNVLQKNADSLARMMNNALVNGVATNIKQTNIASNNSVVGLVTRETLTQKDAVYNLSVDGPLQEYFANGLLVHNCDAALYAWRECKHFYERDFKAPERSIDQVMLDYEAAEADQMQRQIAGGNQFTDVQDWQDLGVDDSIWDD